MYYFYLFILLLLVSDSLWCIWNKTTSQVTNFSTLCWKTFYSPQLYTSLLIPRKKKKYIYKIQISNFSPLNITNPFFCFLFSVLSHSPECHEFTPLLALPSHLPPQILSHLPSLQWRTRCHSRESFSSHLQMYAFLWKCFHTFLQLQRRKQSYSYLGIIPLSTLGIKFPPTFLGPCFNFYENIFQIQLPVGQLLKIPVLAKSNTNYIRNSVDGTQHQYYF